MGFQIGRGGVGWLWKFWCNHLHYLPHAMRMIWLRCEFQFYLIDSCHPRHRPSVVLLLQLCTNDLGCDLDYARLNLLNVRSIMRAVSHSIIYCRQIESRVCQKCRIKVLCSLCKTGSQAKRISTSDYLMSIVVFKHGCYRYSSASVILVVCEILNFSILKP